MFKKILGVVLALLIVAGGVFSYFYVQEKQPKIASSVRDVYALTSDSISKSAPIVIHLPKKANAETAKANTTFSPSVEGDWIASSDSNRLIFKPKNDLDVGKYYAVTLSLEDEIFRSEFRAEDNPEIAAVFPKPDSEADENSDVTIIFNRPMVPLTTLDVLDAKDIPVEISPQTEGTFKWVSTRNLQFVPKEKLIRSSNYTVNLKSGLVSMDGLAIAPSSHHFTTRHLRYEYTDSGEIVYNRPLSLYFNQEIDLKKTTQEIELIDTTLNKNVDFIAEYGLDEVYNEESKKSEKIENRSQLLIFLKSDSNNREKLWNVKHQYKLTLKAAYPAEGDIFINQPKDISFQISDVVAEVSASSERASYSALDFFDPQGKLWIQFYEAVNLSKSNITGDYISGKGYGEKCRELKEGEEMKIDEECEKVPDENKIYLTFDHEKIAINQTWNVRLDSIYNADGLLLNAEQISYTVKSYPAFQIIGSDPASGATNSDITQLFLCSTTPIAAPKIETVSDYEKYISANKHLTMYSWYQGYRVDAYSQDPVCKVGEFRTDIRYGLDPESDYELQLHLNDEFEQKTDTSKSFRTGKLNSEQLAFHHLQQTENVTTPKNTQLGYGLENMTYIDLSICKLDAQTMLQYLEKMPYGYEGPDTLSGCLEKKNDSIKVEGPYWAKNYFTLDLKDYFSNVRGHYILTFSHPDFMRISYKDNRSQMLPWYERTFISVSDLAVLEKKIERGFEMPQNSSNPDDFPDDQLQKLENLYWVTNTSTLDTVSGAKVTLFGSNVYSPYDENFRIFSLATGNTDEKGIVRMASHKNLIGAIVEKDGDSAILNRGTQIQYASDADIAKRVYLITDRPIYRPGDKVYFKGLYRVGYDGDYRIFKDKKVNVTIHSSRGDEIFKKDLDLSDYGTFYDEILLDKDAPLGQYQLCSAYECSYFDLEEYVPAPFEVAVTSLQDEYIAGDTMQLDVNANYYFGVPISGGEVSYTISSQNYYFDRYTDEYFVFDSPWYRCWIECPFGDQFILRNSTTLSSDGKARIAEKLDFETFFGSEDERMSKIFVVDLTVINSNGQSVSSQKSYIIHAGEVYLGITSDKSFLAKDELFTLKVKSVDIQGKPVQQSGIDLIINKISWVQYKRKEVDGQYYYRWEEEKKEIISDRISTDGKGNFSKSYSLSEEGEYSIDVSTTDGRGNTIRNSYNIYVYGDGSASVRPTNDTSLEITTEKGDVRVGDTASVIIQSPFEKAKAFLSIERGDIFRYEVVDINSNFFEYSFKIEENYAPNIYFSAYLQSSKPEVKFGQIQFAVNRDLQELQINVNSSKDTYLPGESVTLDVQALDSAGKGIATELSLAVVDLSVLALKGNPQKNPLVFFYGGFPLTVSTSSSLKNALQKIEVPASTKGGGGGNMSKTMEDSLATKKRGLFADTAFWQAVVQTDADGKAQVSFILPDNLTTWQVESVGITKNTLVGAAYHDFMTRKKVMTVPLKPRFVVPGDVFKIGAKVFNQTDAKQNLMVSFTSDTLKLLDANAEKNISLDAGQNETLYFQVEAPADKDRGIHSFTLSARNDQYEDTVENAISITPNDTYESTATASYTSENTANEYLYLPNTVVKDKGGLTLKISATLAVFLSDAINELIYYPYGCSEQIASKLDAIAIVTRALNLKNVDFELDVVEIDGVAYEIEEIVEMGLASLYNNQNYDGGFAYYNGESNFYLTLHLLNTLQDLKIAGFEVREEVIGNAVNYIRDELSKKSKVQRSKSLYILAAYTLNKISGSDSIDSSLQSIILELLDDEAFLNETISNTELAYFAILLSRTTDVSERDKNALYDQLENRIEIDARGAFIPMNKNNLWQYYETPIQNTALFLKAIVSDNRDTKVTDLMLRWLLNSRDKSGTWGSTHNTLAVIDALTDYLAWTRETESEFDLEIFIDGDSVSKYTFNKDTVFDQPSSFVSVSDLKFDVTQKVSFVRNPLNDLKNNFYYDMSLKYYFPIDQIPSRDEGFTLTRELFALDDKKGETPLREAELGDILRGRITVYIPEDRNFVAIEDFIPAGMEIVNFNLATEDKSLLIDEEVNENFSETEYVPIENMTDSLPVDSGIGTFYPDSQENHDDRVFLFKERVAAGVYTFDYFVRALVPGKFHHLPAVASEMYFPENFGRTDGRYFEIKE